MQEVGYAAVWRPYEKLQFDNVHRTSCFVQAKTFWLPAGACPTTSLEKIAKAVFDFHSKNLGHNQHLHPHQDSPDATPGSTPRSAAACNSKRWGDGRAPHGGMSPTVATSPQAGYAESGAEWWVQRRQEGRHEDLGMPFHWDKDEKMLDQEGVVVCPAVSTVTYLTEDGAPTVVVEVCTSLFITCVVMLCLFR